LEMFGQAIPNLDLISSHAWSASMPDSR
jgi:hypothetical protein